MRSPLTTKLEHHRGHTVLAFANGSTPHVVDGGAHLGEFAASVHAAWGARCEAIEASPTLFAQMNVPATTTTHQFAISDTDGTTNFSLSGNPEASTIRGDAHSALADVTVPARSLGSFLSQVAPEGLDLLKLDIEGAEIVALASVSDRQLQTITQITVEFHDFCGYVSREDVDDVIARLTRLGFVAFNFAFHTRGDMLFVNSRVRALSAWEKFQIGTLQRFARRLFRRRA